MTHLLRTAATVTMVTVTVTVTVTALVATLVAISSPASAIAPQVVRPHISWSMPATAQVGTTVRVRTTITPSRKLPVRLQQQVNGVWQYVASGTTRKARQTIRFVLTTTGPGRFRVVYVRPGADLRSSVRTLRGRPGGAALATTRVSVTSRGSEVGGSSYDGSISDDGRYVAFVSFARNLVRGDTNDAGDVFLKDLTTGSVTLVSHGRGGAARGHSTGPAISGDGRFVVFASTAPNLVRQDRGRGRDIFVWARATGAITRVGQRAADAAISRTGRYVTYTSGKHVYLADRTAHTTTRLSQTASGAAGNGASSAAAISADGRYVAYGTLATNLTDAGQAGVVRYDRLTGASELVSVGVPARTQPARRPQLDADGSVVAFEVVAPTYYGGEPQVYVRDLEAGTTRLVSARGTSVPEYGRSHLAAISDDGGVVLFTSSSDLVDDDRDDEYCPAEWDCVDTEVDAYTADVGSGVVSLVSRTWDGRPSVYGAVADDLRADGGSVVFSSGDRMVPGATGRSDRYAEFGTQYGVDDVYLRVLEGVG